MKRRSPIRGYNHNIRYGGRQYHVQTEDSGVANPHLFTHLFFAGTILATRKSDYPPDEDERLVQKRMQEQHKNILRDLRDGLFDVKIAQFFGEKLSAHAAAVAAEEEAAAAEGAPPAEPAQEFAPEPTRDATPARIEEETTDPELWRSAASAAELAARAQSRREVPREPDTAPTPRVDLDVEVELARPPGRRPGSPTPARGLHPVPTGRTPVSPVSLPARVRSAFDLPPPPGSAIAPSRPAMGVGRSPAREAGVPASRSGTGVVVTRSVVVGVPGGSAAPPPGPPRRPAAPPAPAPTQPAAPASGTTAAPSPGRRPSQPPVSPEAAPAGDDPLADKSLDEVILAYLAEDGDR